MNAVPGTSSNETGIADAACFGCAHIASHTMETRGRETSWERAVDEASTASKATQALARNLRGARVLNNTPALRGLAPGGSTSEIVEIVAWFAAAAVIWHRTLRELNEVSVRTRTGICALPIRSWARRMRLVLLRRAHSES